jgi:hypothetical protein
MWKQADQHADAREILIGFQPRGVIVCLSCGKTRRLVGGRFLAECPFCGDLGWADSTALSHAELRRLSNLRRLGAWRRGLDARRPGSAASEAGSREADVVYAPFGQPPTEERKGHTG